MQADPDNPLYPDNLSDLMRQSKPDKKLEG